MLKKIAAALIAAGLVLPYGCDIQPVTQLWGSPGEILAYGLPVLGALAYALHVLLPPIARFHERHGPAIHGILRALIFILFGVYLSALLEDLPDSAREVISAIATLGIPAALLFYNQGRGSKTQRLPLLLLILASFFQMVAFVTFVGEGMQYGGWIFSVGYFAAAWLEVKALAGTPKVAHSG